MTEPRRFFCECDNSECTGEGGWWNDSGNREFYVTADEPIVCPECGKDGRVYPY